MSNLKNILIKKISCKSIWFMRQAGRYLPEFRKIRSQNKNFIKLCLNSELSSEISLQPIKRYDLDSAIIFSDILMTPYALGQNVEFTKNNGPQLSELDINKILHIKEADFSNKLNPVYKAIEITRKKLHQNKSLISFVGAPWTLLVYMLSLKKDKNSIDVNILKKKNSEIKLILNKLINFLCIHIQNQINAGSDVIQIFDSWAGLLPDEHMNEFCYNPNYEIVSFCRDKKIPSICFPKGINKKYSEFSYYVKPDGINLDYEISPLWAKENLKDVVIQGGLDPKILLEKDENIYEAATKYIQTFKDIPYVFNLGHGLLPETDPDKVNKLIKFYRNF